MNNGRGRAALVIAAIVIGSALAGAALDRLLLSHAPRHGRAPGSQPTPEQDAKRRQETLDRMTRDLDLSAAQRVGIDSVMQRTDSALRVVRGEMQPRLRQIFDASRAEITSRLDSAQRVKYAKLKPPRRR
jgi:Spy/CpxP family protein refolding chaperone